MKKVLVIAYFYPPCNMAGAQRAASWAKYLPGNNWKTVVITRKWEREIREMKDAHYATSRGVNIDSTGEAEIHRIPFKPGLRDVLMTNNGKLWAFPRKVFSLVILMFEPVIWWLSSERSFNSYVRRYLKKYAVDTMLITGGPFQLFRIGYEMHRKYGIPWIADYRDPWSSAQAVSSSVSDNRVLRRWMSRFEVKWTSNAAMITSTTSPHAEEIGRFVGKPNRVVMNGFEPTDFDAVKGAPKFEAFTITYVGSLYKEQHIEIFIGGFKRFMAQNPGANARLCFVGVTINSAQAHRVQNLLAAYDTFAEFSGRIDRTEVLRMEVQSHVLLYVAWQKEMGYVGSKVYEYIASGTPLLVVPSDHGVVDDILKQTGAGWLADTAAEVTAILEDCYRQYLGGNAPRAAINSERLHSYSRAAQAKIMAEIVNSL